MAYNANALMLACEADDVDEARDMISAGKPNIGAVDERGRNVLHYCAANSTKELAELLLQKKKALLKVKDKQDVQPLHVAVVAGNQALIELFLQYKVDLNATDKEGHTVIHLAVANGHVELIDFLLSNGAKLNRPDKHNAFALHYAVQLCASEGTAPTTEEPAPKPKGKKGGKKENSVSTHDKPNRGIEMLQTLLTKDVDEDCRDKDQRTPLIWAASSGLRRVCEILLADGASLEISDKDGMTALHAAVTRNQTEMIGFLIKQGSNVNNPDKNGCTPIFYAIAMGHALCAENLFRYGADANHKDLKGRTPAHCAATKGSMQLLTMILHNSGNLWVKNQKGDTPAHEATVSRQNATIRFLLDQADDADAVNTQNNENATCLHIAAISNNLELCKILISCGARKDMMMHHLGREISAEEAALLKFNQEVVDLLQNMATGAPYEGGGGGGGAKKDKKEKKDKKSKKKKK